jgi:hypothetical protein
LVDPDYATRFAAVPKTIFVDEYGVVLNARNWEAQLEQLDAPRPVPEGIRSQWTPVGARLDSVAIAALAQLNRKNPDDLRVATRLGSRYLALGLQSEAQAVLRRAIESYDPKVIAQKESDISTLLGQAYFQLSRACEGDRQQQVKYATLSYFVAPTIGYGKQIARIIDPKKFDGRPQGDFDNRFREGTLRRLVSERQAWLSN